MIEKIFKTTASIGLITLFALTGNYIFIIPTVIALTLLWFHKEKSNDEHIKELVREVIQEKQKQLSLEEQLNVAVFNENYEEAAKLRDIIKNNPN